MLKIFLSVLGVLMFFGGFLGALVSAGMKTTVGDTHNIGLIGQQQAGTIFCAAVGIAGAVFLAAVGVIDALQAQARGLGEAAEKESKSQAAMLRLLDAIDGNTRHVEPYRPAAGKTDAAFDAVVAAELQAPRPPARNRTPPPVR